MSDQHAGQANPRKPSTNKNIKKLRAISMVCGLTSSWQQWVTDNEKKQANEPSGWSPASLEGPTDLPKKTWVPKERPHAQAGPTKVQDCEEDTLRSSTGGAEKPEIKAVLAEPAVVSLIKVKPVVRTVTTGVQDKGAGISLLTQKIQRDSADQDLDRLLKKRGSPTLRRKCSNMVSSVAKSWKQVEKDQKPGEEECRKRVGEGDEAGMEDDRLDEEDPAAQDDTAGDTESTRKIKRPSAPVSKKEAKDANKINTLSKKYSEVGNLKSRWQNWASEHTVNQKLNPFSEYFDYDYSMSLRLQRGQEGYGRPKDGTKTAERAKRAEKHIHREIDDMCLVIRTLADPDPDGKTRVTFGRLFDRYVRISDKVVGILMRARKHGKVAFEGEMLWQGQDDAVIITLLV